MGQTDQLGKTKLRIGVVDNDRCALEFMVAMLRSLNNRDGRKIDVWSTENPAQAIQECRFGTQETNILIIDMALSGITGAQVCSEIRKHKSTVGIIGITSYEPSSYLKQMQQAGAQALLDKSTLRTTLLEALDSVAQGLAYPQKSGFLNTSEAIERSKVQPQTIGQHKLTSTEQLVVTLSLSRLTAKQVATKLNISVDTVFSHRRNIKNKLAADTWQEALDQCRTQHIL